MRTLENYLDEALSTVNEKYPFGTIDEEARERMVREYAGTLANLRRTNLVCDPADAIKDDSITCCICGEPFTMLHHHHLKLHGLTSAQYKEMCGYSPRTKLCAKSLATTRAAQQRAAWARRKNNA